MHADRPSPSHINPPCLTSSQSDTLGQGWGSQSGHGDIWYCLRLKQSFFLVVVVGGRLGVQVQKSVSPAFPQAGLSICLRWVGDRGSNSLSSQGLNLQSVHQKPCIPDSCRAQLTQQQVDGFALELLFNYRLPVKAIQSLMMLINAEWLFCKKRCLCERLIIGYNLVCVTQPS